MLEPLLTFVQTPIGHALLFGGMTVVPFVRIFRRAGLPGWPAVFMFVPLAGLVIVFGILAVLKWRAVPVAAER